jgi:hypothetical protein
MKKMIYSKPFLLTEDAKKNEENEGSCQFQRRRRRGGDRNVVNWASLNLLSKT